MFRAAGSNAERIRSQSQVTHNEMYTIDEKSHALFGSSTFQTPRSTITAHRKSIATASTENFSMLNNVSTASSSIKPNSSRSLNFSGMISAAEERIIHFATSGLKDADFRLAKAFCEKFPVILQDKLTVESTHLIVRTDSENRTCRTFKYLQAIVNNLYIVSVNWMMECLRLGYIVSEVKIVIILLFF